MDTVKITLISINFVTLMFSFIGNVFIIVVTILDFHRNRRLALSDQLQIGFNVFNLLYGLNEGYELYSNLLPGPRNDHPMKAIYLFSYLNLCTLWFSALLSIYFCLKIVSINHRFYIGLQRRFPTLLPWIIIAFPLGYFFIYIYSALVMDQECLQNTTSTAIVSINVCLRSSWSLLIFLLTCTLCAFLCLVSVGSILVSLLKHMRRIKENSEGSRSPNMDAHIRAIKTITISLIANILIFMFVSVLAFRELDGRWEFILGILILTCHIIASNFFILGTKKLHMALTEILNLCGLGTVQNTE